MIAPSRATGSLRIKMPPTMIVTEFREGEWTVKEVKLGEDFCVEKFVFGLQRKDEVLPDTEMNAEDVYYHNKSTLDKVMRSMRMPLWQYRGIRARRNRRVKERIALNNEMTVMEHELRMPSGSDPDPDESGDSTGTEVERSDDSSTMYDASDNSAEEDYLSEKEIMLLVDENLDSDGTEDERDRA